MPERRLAAAKSSDFSNWTRTYQIVTINRWTNRSSMLVYILHVRDWLFFFTGRLLRMPRLAWMTTTTTTTMDDKQKMKNNNNGKKFLAPSWRKNLATLDILSTGKKIPVSLHLFSSISIKSCLMIKNCLKECDKWKTTWSQFSHQLKWLVLNCRKCTFHNKCIAESV